MQEAAKKGDFFITVTGCKNVIDEEDLRVMKDGAILSNAGHFDVEVSKPALNKLAADVTEARDNIRKFEMEDGRKIYLLADGRLVNLAAGDGHPAEIMDMTFSFPQLISHAAKTRKICAGSIIGSGTVSNIDRSKGSSCIVERRMLEAIAEGKAKTPFMKFGDTIRIEMKDQNDENIFGAINQTVKSSK
jgi:2-keto-4-pentenoate hydratase/2-oxohepta-3-ene-1,7-dioic acid hydratase in catechol pathway